MTFQDVFNQILSEVTGHSREFVDEIAARFRKMYPDWDYSKWDRPLDDEKAAVYLRQFRKEKTGIKKWLIEGSLKYKHRN
jgi:hypothetical protein